MTENNNTIQELMQAKARIRELEQYITQADTEFGRLIEQHNRELKALQVQIAELNSANVKYRQLLEEKSNG